MLTLEQFRATRRAPPADLDPALRPSDAPATEEFLYGGDGEMLWFIRHEAEGFVYEWTHPCNSFGRDSYDFERFCA